MTTNTGGPAFPCQDIIRRNDTGGLYGHEISSDGMTLRDYFAAHAPDVPSDFPIRKIDVVETHGAGKRVIKQDESECARIVHWRWHYADSMLKARDK